MAEITVETEDGKSTKFIHAFGVTFPTEFKRFMPAGESLSEHIQNVRYMDTRDDDVYLATFPKSGTNWAWEIIKMLQNGSKEHETSTMARTFLDIKSLESVNEVQSPRVLTTHYPLQLIPLKVLEKKNKIIHVQRNPKDVAVSFFNHLKQICSQELVTQFPEMLKMFIGQYGVELYSNWADYVKGWEKFSAQNPDQILNLYYEDMKEDPVREIRKINAFLGCDRSDDLIKGIAEACSFEKLKVADVEVKEKTPRPKLFRKGEVGDWKNWFTVAQNEMFDAWLKEKLCDTQLKFRYTL